MNALLSYNRYDERRPSVTASYSSLKPSLPAEMSLGYGCTTNSRSTSMPRMSCCLMLMLFIGCGQPKKDLTEASCMNNIAANGRMEHVPCVQYFGHVPGMDLPADNMEVLDSTTTLRRRLDELGFTTPLLDLVQNTAVLVTLPAKSPNDRLIGLMRLEGGYVNPFSRRAAPSSDSAWNAGGMLVSVVVVPRHLLQPTAALAPEVWRPDLKKAIEVAALRGMVSGPPITGRGARRNAAASLQNVSVGAFSASVPNDWIGYGPTELAQLRQQYEAQSEEIFRQFSGLHESTRTVDLAAFHIADNAGTFVFVSFTVPPTSNLIDLLRSQVDEKMAWGVREGHIREYLGLVSVEKGDLSGFYTEAIGSDGAIELSGGLQHDGLRGTVIQLTLLSPVQWDRSEAKSALNSILESVSLRDVRR